MEQHPIPQDVTGFQFKLIGSMTVKQFGFVAAGGILAVISWYAPAPNFLWQFVAKGLCVPLFGISGVVIAFIPIEGRPIDVMAMNFFHALISPNQYIYIKKGRKFRFTQITYAKQQATQAVTQQKPHLDDQSKESRKEHQLRALLSQSYKGSKSTLDQKESAFLQSINSTPLPQAPALRPIATASLPTPKPLAPPPPLPVPKPIQQAQIKPPAPMTPQPMPLAPKPLPPPGPPRQTVAASQTSASNAGFPHVSDTPNVIVGIVKDPRGNLLPNMLVEVKDREGNPVRAFKTNPLGQFASATPLATGMYTVELEDPKKQHAFTPIQVNPNGQIMMPIEIISHDAREELRQALFTN